MSASIFHFAYVLKSSATNINTDVSKRMVQCQQYNVLKSGFAPILPQQDILIVWPNFAFIDYKLLAKTASSYFSTSTYVVYTRKNRLNEAVL